MSIAVVFFLGLAALVAFFFIGIALDKHLERERSKVDEWKRTKSEIEKANNR